MAYGLRIINDNSELLIDSDYINPTFVQKLEFNTTPTFTEAGLASAQAHPNFIRRDYSTPTVSIGTGKYIVLWYLPDSIVSGQADKDVWYVFPTSTAENNLKFDCSVYANSQGTPISYSLPTAYVFAIDAAGIGALTSSAYGLRMYNATNQKTFDSNFTQLVPYSISDVFSMPTGETPVNLYLSVPTNPIYLLPKTATLFAGDQTAVNGSTNTYYKVFDVAFRRRGQYIDSRTMSSSYTTEPDSPIGTNFVSFFAGSFSNLSVIAADADLYQSPASSTGGGANPTYQLTSNYTAASPINETTNKTLTVTFTTTLITNGTVFPYTVTGINSSDLTSGSLSGSFIVQNNSATATFIFSSDNLTEDVENFVLTITNLTGVSITVPIADTSVLTEYSWSTTPSSVNEGASSSLTFNYAGAANKTITFSIVAPSSGVNGTADITLSTTTYTVGNTNASSSISVGYSAAADTIVDGDKYFAIKATIDTVTRTSTDITIVDKTTTASITVASSINESTSSNAVTISATNLNGSNLYLSSSNTAVLDIQIPYANSWTPNSNSYSATTYVQAGAVTANTSVTLYLRKDNATTGTLLDSKTVTVKDILPYGTAIGSPYCVAYGVAPYTLRQVRADGYGSTYNDDTSNSTTCGYIAPSYVLSTSATSVSEGGTFTITLTTNQSGSFAYTITGIESADLQGTDTSLTGSLSNAGTRTFSVKADALTEGTQTFSIKLDNNLSNTITVSISDTSKTPTSIEQSGSTSGTTGTAFSSNFVMKIDGVQYPAIWSSTGTIPTGLTLTKNGNTSGNYYNVYTLSGTPTATGTFTFTISAVASNAVADTASATYSVTIGAPTPTYSWGTVGNIDENSVSGSTSFLYNNAVSASATFSVIAPTGSYRSGVSDVVLSTTSATLNGSSSLSVSYYTTADQVTEGYEYFRLRATIGGVNYDSTDIVISDTSKYPAQGTLVGNPYCGTGANQYTKYQNVADGSGGTTASIVETNSTFCGYTAPYSPQWRTTTGTTTWTVPASITSIYVVVIGGGGGGRSFSAGGGGGAGGTNQNTSLAVTPGSSLTFTVGAGGGSNTAGGASSVSVTGGSVLFSCAGGSPGAGLTGGSGAAGAFGTFAGALGASSGGFVAGGGGGGSTGPGQAGFDGEGGDGGTGLQFSVAFSNGTTTYNLAAGGGGAGQVQPGPGGMTKTFSLTDTGMQGGGGTGGTGVSAQAGGAATQPGSGGGGGRLNAAGGAGYRGQIWWYG